MFLHLHEEFFVLLLMYYGLWRFFPQYDVAGRAPLEADESFVEVEVLLGDAGVGVEGVLVAFGEEALVDFIVEVGLGVEHVEVVMVAVADVLVAPRPPVANVGVDHPILYITEPTRTMELRRIEVQEKSPEWNQVLFQLQFRTGKASVKIINLHKYNTPPIEAPYDSMNQTVALVEVSDFKRDYKRDLICKVLPLGDMVFNCGLLEVEEYEKQPTMIHNVLIGKVALGTIGSFEHTAEEADSVLVEEQESTVPYHFEFQVKHYEQYQVQYEASFVVEDESDYLIEDPICTSCDSRVAEFYCRENNHYYCRQCGIQHQRDTNLVGANGKKTPPQTLEALTRLNTLPNCQQHRSKYEHYCLTCQKYLCGVCLQKGTHAQNTEHVVRNIQYHFRYAQEETQALENSLEKRIKEITQTAEQREKEINQNYDQVRAHLKKQFDYAFEELNRLYKQRIIRVVSDEIELRRMQEQIEWGRFLSKHLEQKIKPLIYFKMQSRYQNELKELKVNGYESAFTLKADLDSQLLIRVGTEQEMEQVRRRDSPTVYKYTQNIPHQSAPVKESPTISIDHKKQASLLTYNERSPAPAKGKLSLLLDNSNLHFFKIRPKVDIKGQYEAL